MIFVTLTGQDGILCHINMDHVVYMRPLDGGTFLSFANESLTVTETAEEIRQKYMEVWGQTTWAEQIINSPDNDFILALSGELC